MDKLEELHYFTTPIYSIVKTEFLDPIRALSAKHLEHSKEHMKSDKPMTVMTGNFSLESEAADFAHPAGNLKPSCRATLALSTRFL